MFPWFTDVSLVAPSGRAVAGTTAAGFALTVTGNQVMCVRALAARSSGSVAVYVGAPRIRCSPVPEMSSTTLVCVRLPPISELCAESEECLLRGNIFLRVWLGARDRDRDRDRDRAGLGLGLGLC